MKASTTTSALKMEAVYSSETLVYTYKTTRRYKPEYQHRPLHRRQNLKSQTEGPFQNNVEIATAFSLFDGRDANLPTNAKQAATTSLHYHLSIFSISFST
jgi:hypothetical protein